MPLIMWTQVWYADDVSACGKLSHLCWWFDLFLEIDPSFAIFQSPRRTQLLLVRHLGLLLNTSLAP